MGGPETATYPALFDRTEVGRKLFWDERVTWVVVETDGGKVMVAGLSAGDLAASANERTLAVSRYLDFMPISRPSSWPARPTHPIHSIRAPLPWSSGSI